MTLTVMTKDELKNLDATATTVGLTREVLMERSGMALAAAIERSVKRGSAVVFLCGPGNNGGDGFVAARHLHHQGVQVSVVVCEQPRKAAARNNQRLVGHLGVPVQEWERGFSFTPYDLIVDCLLGYDQRGAARGAIREAVIAARKSGKPCVACDVPTGVDATSGEALGEYLPASRTISFVAPKRGFLSGNARSLCGEITIRGIGIPRFVYELISPGGSFLVEGEERFKQPPENI